MGEFIFPKCFDLKKENGTSSWSESINTIFYEVT